MTVLNSNNYKKYIDKFNSDDEESVIQHIDNKSAWNWLETNIPFLDCPDKEIEKTYYFRWWVFRKHLKLTEDGIIISEFHPDVSWAGKYNSIVCAAGHHIYEGRWLRSSKDFIRDYAVFWFRKGGNLRAYSTWLVDAIWNYCKVTGDFKVCTELLDDFVDNYHAWETSNMDDTGLFWSNDDRDGMEYSISGPGLRLTINSYMYADALAISEIAKLSGKKDIEDEFSQKAQELKRLIQQRLWDKSSEFFISIPQKNRDDAREKSDTPGKSIEMFEVDESGCRAGKVVRELTGFIPWYFNVPDPGYEAAWEQLMDKDGFNAPYGLTTAEQRHHRFMLKYADHECLWNGPVWPFATSQVLTSAANLLSNYKQNVFSKKDYYNILKGYAKSHHRYKPDGTTVFWIDENLDPSTGEWLSRSILEKWGWRENKGGYERGKDYNHSTFCDLVISGFIGLKPREDNVLEINPLIPEDWEYFCLDNVMYHGRSITVLYDKDGTHYNRGGGFQIFADNKLLGKYEFLGSLRKDSYTYFLP